MASVFGNKIKVSIFGQSHSEGIGVVIDGLPAGVKIDMAKLQTFLDRRAPGNSELSTARKEEDKPEFIAGLAGPNMDTTCGAPLTAIIRNRDVRSEDYDEIPNAPRPGHADYTAHVKYGGAEDYRGGGHFSGRITAGLCVAGNVAMQILGNLGISFESKILQVGGVDIPDGDEGESKLRDVILAAKEEGDSVGGIVECKIYGVPVGVGEPIFDGIENHISQAVFGIPAIKGIEFGAGFKAAAMKGSENNDSFTGPIIRTTTNNAGGILGGIANGDAIVFRVAVKPTPSIAKEQDSVNYETGESVKMVVKGRHDPCIVLRVLPCVEAAAAIAILDLMV